MFLDAHHTFTHGIQVAVCGNSYDMLHETRFAKHFEFMGNNQTHLGIFEGCGTEMPFNESKQTTSSCC